MKVNVSFMWRLRLRQVQVVLYYYHFSQGCQISFAHTSILQIPLVSTLYLKPNVFLLVLRAEDNPQCNRNYCKQKCVPKAGLFEILGWEIACKYHEGKRIMWRIFD